MTPVENLVDILEYRGRKAVHTVALPCNWGGGSSKVDVVLQEVRWRYPNPPGLEYSDYLSTYIAMLDGEQVPK